MDSEKNNEMKLNENELKEVSGGNGHLLYANFDECTKLLKEAGDKAWTCSRQNGFYRFSPLHSNISAAEHSSDETSRLSCVNTALGEMAGGYQNVKYCAFNEDDFNYIKTRLKRVKTSIENRANPKFIA